MLSTAQRDPKRRAEALHPHVVIYIRALRPCMCIMTSSITHPHHHARQLALPNAKNCVVFLVLRCSCEFPVVTCGKKTKISRCQGTPPPSRQMFTNRPSASTHSSKDTQGLLKKKRKNDMMMMTPKSGDCVWAHSPHGEMWVLTILLGIYITK